MKCEQTLIFVRRFAAIEIFRRTAFKKALQYRLRSHLVEHGFLFAPEQDLTAADCTTARPAGVDCGGRRGPRDAAVRPG